jgi:hypothetical protein
MEIDGAQFAHAWASTFPSKHVPSAVKDGGHHAQHNVN